MGVNNLWKALGSAVQTLEGHNSGQHSEIVEAVENKVIAVDLSAWLMQAQSQPALLEHYDSPYARAAKVVFDRTIHWLRYGCLPVFVIEGQTPAAKLEKLRQRCLAQYGPTARSYDVGNRAGGQFDRLGQAMKRLLDAFGVPCVQASGEGEAMCAALNLCGWAHACHTLDVDVLLFGALTVYRQMHLQTDDPRKSSLVRCCRSDVQRLLGISRGGEAALQCIAQLAGGDYDTTGAEQVGEGMAMDAVRHLLQGCEDDEAVLQKLEAALAAGPDPELDALTKCTGCKVCGHEGGMKSRIAQHSKRSGGCTGCGCDSGCVPRQWQQCECNFHRRAGERLLNRVVRRAVQTPGFMNSCRTAAATYTSELHKAVAAVQREYSLPVPGSSRNVFTWRARPDVHAIADIMTKYIKEWDHNQVRLKLLPLLLEWDMRQGPQPGPSSGVQFKPTGIRKVSSKGAEDMSGVPARQQQGWRYVLLVERLQQQQRRAADADEAAEELAVDLAWIAGTARSRPAKLASSSAAPSHSAAAAGSAGGEYCDADGELCLSQMPASQGPSFSCSQAAPASQAAGSGGGRSGGSLQFSEHRSVRCSLVEAVWPDLVAAYRNPPASSARARSAGRKKAAAAAEAQPAAAAAALTAADKQRNLKGYFNTVKDYTAAAKPSSKPGGRQPAAADGGSIPGLAGIAVGSGAAAAVADFGQSVVLLAGSSSRMPAVEAAAVGTIDAGAGAGSAGGGGAAAAAAGGWASSTTKGQPPKKSFTDWLDSMMEEEQHDEQQQQQQQQQEQHLQQLEDLQQSQHDPWGYGQPPTAAQPHRSGADAAGDKASRPTTAAADTGQGAHRVFVGMRGGKPGSAAARPATAGAAAAASGDAAGRTPAAAVRTPAAGRGRGRGSAKQVMRAGALERFLQPAAPVQLSDSECGSQGQQHRDSAAPAAVDEVKREQPHYQQQQQQQHVAASSPLKRHPADAVDCTSDSPELLPLAARLQANKSKLGPAGVAAAVAAATAAAGGAGMAPPAKKVSTDRAKELLASPPTPSSQQCQQQHTSSPAGAAGQGRLTAQFAALLDEAGVLSPVPQRQQAGIAAQRPKSAAKELFAARPPSSRQHQQQQRQQQQQHQDVIELLDSPADAGGLQQHRSQLTAGALAMGGAEVGDEVDVVDLT